jgi:hypothetical protein
LWYILALSGQSRLGGTKEAAMRNYSGRGWEGSEFDTSKDIKEIAKILRQRLKKEFPASKFSVTIERYSMGQSMSIALLESDVQVMKDPLAKHEQVNQYYIKDSDLWTDKGKELLQKVYQMASGFNYDDSDSMIDYFDTNFYLHLSVGKWDKPFVCSDPMVFDPQTGMPKMQMVCDLLVNAKVCCPSLTDDQLRTERDRLLHESLFKIKNMYVMNLG